MRSAVEGLDGEPSSEAEFAPRVRMGRTVYLGRELGFFLFISFPSDRREAVDLPGPDCLMYVLRFKGDLVPWLGCL